MTTTDDLRYATAAAQPRTLAIPSSGTRDLRLDFFRGIAMFIILMAHIPGNWWTLWIPARFGFSDATEIFVFCSGMASAIAFGKTFERAGLGIGTARVVFRVWQVYWAHIGMFLVIAVFVSTADASGLFEKNYTNGLNLPRFFRDTPENLFGLMTLTYVPNYFDVLPMYMGILGMLPIVVFLAGLSRWLAGAAVITVWLLANADLLAFPAEPWSDREWFFNPFGWQLIFFTGFAFMRGWLPAPPVRWWLIALAVAVVLANIPLSSVGMREFGFDWARDWRNANSVLIAKTDFGILRYIHFLAMAYIAWVIAGDGGRRLVAMGSGFFSTIWNGIVTVILKVGQQSLIVFVFSMVLARVLGLVLDIVGDTALTMLATNLLGAALIVAAAYVGGWFKSQPWRPRRTAA